MFAGLNTSEFNNRLIKSSFLFLGWTDLCIPLNFVSCQISVYCILSVCFDFCNHFVKIDKINKMLLFFCSDIKLHYVLQGSWKPGLDEHVSDHKLNLFGLYLLLWTYSPKIQKKTWLFFPIFHFKQWWLLTQRSAQKHGRTFRATWTPTSTPELPSNNSSCHCTQHV